MRKFILSILGLTFATMVSAQNIQLHYDFGRNIYTGEEAGRFRVSSIWASSRPLLLMLSTMVA